MDIQVDRNAVEPSPSSPSPFYYLLNFERALAWVSERYDDLLDAIEREFASAFARLPLASRALLVRMLMRNGPRFRTSKLNYAEIGCPLAAAAPLIALGWIDPEPHLSIDDLFALATRPELERIFSEAVALRRCSKSELRELLRAEYGAQTRPYRAWDATSDEQAFELEITPVCDRVRLMFFGNLHQSWSEFVLADLGVYRYEAVSFEPSARAFQRRSDVDAYLALQACREALEGIDGIAALRELFGAVLGMPIENAWLEMRRAKLFYRIGYRAEQLRDWEFALEVYERSQWPEARHRRMRVLERCARFGDAFALVTRALEAPENEAEYQRAARMMPRLARRLGQPVQRAAEPAGFARSTLTLMRPAVPLAVEYVVQDHLDAPQAPVFYVENTLINSLFGLLCWEAVFEPVPGSFFHPFQRGPADLHAPDFLARRAETFARCFAQLDSGAYHDTIWRHYEHKAGMQSPFVFWGALTSSLMTLALDCLPASHLKLWFARLLSDIRANRSGLPDLIRFWPTDRRYELIEVKGPGDRLQDNQIRWLAYCAQHGMPARVLDVRWDGEVEAEVDDECGIDGSSERAVAGVTTPGAGVTP
jgi:tetratricopeptide (TPR) repeat protein